MDEFPPPERPNPPGDRRRHPYHMHDMMRRQPIAARSTLSAVRDGPLPKLPGEGRVLWTGIGSSFHAAMALARAGQAESLTPLRRGWAVPAFELRSAATLPPEVSLAVAFSASGQTDVTRRAMERLRAEGIPIVLVTAEPSSPLAGIADDVVGTKLADDASWTHTVCYTAALVAGHALLARWVGDPKERSELLDTVPDALTAALAVEGRLVDVAERLADRERWMLVGSGPRSVSVREGALKLREGAGRFVATVGVEELLHGPLASIDDRTVVAALTGSPLETARARHGLDAVGQIGGETMLFDSTPGAAEPDGWTSLPLPGALSCVVDAIPFQLLAYWMAVSTGRNPDMMGLDDARHLAARARFGL